MNVTTVVSLIIIFGYAPILSANDKLGTAEKKAPLQVLFPNSYGHFRMLHFLDGKKQNDGSHIEEPTAEVHYTLGSTFLEGDLDMSVVLGAEKKEKTTEVKQRRTNFYSELKIIQIPVYYLGFYLNLWAPQKGIAVSTQGDLGIYTSLGEVISGSWGELNLTAAINGSGLFFSRESFAHIEVPGQVYLKDYLTEKAEELDAKRSIVASTYSLAWKWKPSFAPSWSIAATGYYDRIFIPLRQVDEAGEINSKYGVVDQSSSEIELTYAYDFDVTIQNRFYQNFLGFYAEKKHRVTYSNILSVNVALF